MDASEDFWRKQLQRYSGLGVLASATTVGIACGYYQSYYGGLISWLCFWLCLFHWIFFKHQQITQRQVKLIDYPYLASAAIAVLLLAWGQQRDRDYYLAKLDDLQTPITRADLVNYIDKLADRHNCKRAAELNTEGFCTWIAGTRRAIDSNMSRDELTKLLELARKVGSREGWNQSEWLLGFSPCFAQKKDRWTGQPMEREEMSDELRRQCTIVRNRIGQNADWGTIVRSLERILSLAGYGTTDEWYRTAFDTERYRRGWFIGLLITLAWPYLLAFSLALRLTKVTADVSGWAKP